MRDVHTWQAGTTLHSVCFLSITQPADVEAQRFDIINTLRHHQVLMHEVAAVRARLGQKERMYLIIIIHIQL